MYYRKSNIVTEQNSMFFGSSHNESYKAFFVMQSLLLSLYPESVGVKILFDGNHNRHLRNNGTVVIQSNYGDVGIRCQLSDGSYPVFFAPHITRVEQASGTYTKKRKTYRFRKYILGTPQPEDSGIFSCRRRESDAPLISFHVQIKGKAPVSCNKITTKQYVTVINYYVFQTL